MPTQRKQILLYLAACSAPILALLLHLALVQRFHQWPPFVLFIVLVLLVAAWGGLLAGLLATITSAILVIYRVLPPTSQLTIGRTADVLGLAVFCTVGVGVSVLAGRYHRYRRRSVDYQQELAIYEAKRESEERFRALVTATSDVVYSMSPDWSEMRRLHGKAFLADTKTPNRAWLQQYVHPDDQSRVLTVINEAIRTKSVLELESRVFRADGGLGWAFSRVIPLLDERGEILEWFGATSDITERKRAEEVWRYLSAIVESSYDAIIGLTLEGTITSWNPAAEQLYGYSAAEMLGQSKLVLLPPGAPDDISVILHKLAKREHIDDYETVRRRKDGSLVDVSMRISPILEESGNVIGASTIAHDMTYRKQAREALLRSEKLAAAGRLATAIAHEVNNPLAGAMNALYIARTITAQANKMLDLAEQELRRAAHMTELTLGSYRESGGQQQVTIPQLVEEVLTLYTTKLQNRNVTVLRRYCCGLGSRREGCQEGCGQCARCFMVNAGDMRQIISNLLANGIDAISNGGVIEIRVSRLSDRVQLTIADNGYGIRAENLKRIFEPFFTTKEAWGTGLGLWMTQELVHKHNGLIKVRSRKGKGTVFRLTFPQQAEVTVGSASPTSLARTA